MANMVSVLFSALFGASIVYFFNLKLQKAKNELELKNQSGILHRDKLEELYVMSEKYFNSITMYYLQYIMVMQGQLTIDQVNDLIIKNSKNTNIDYHRLQMIIDFYFESLAEQFSRILTIRDETNSLILEYKQMYRSGKIDGNQYVPKIEALMEKLFNEADKFKNLILELSKKDLSLL
jgi:hypothetical protein